MILRTQLIAKSTEDDDHGEMKITVAIISPGEEFCIGHHEHYPDLTIIDFGPKRYILPYPLDFVYETIAYSSPDDKIIDLLATYLRNKDSDTKLEAQVKRALQVAQNLGKIHN